MLELNIRNARLDDSPAAASLISQLGYPTTQEEMAARLPAILHDPNYITLVAENQQKVVGIAGIGVGRYYEKDGSYGRLLVLAVDENWRAKGVGSLLVVRAEAELKGRGVTSIVVNSGNHREDAHRFYKRLGFEETGVRFVKYLP